MIYSIIYKISLTHFKYPVLYCVTLKTESQSQVSLFGASKDSLKVNSGIHYVFRVQNGRNYTKRQTLKHVKESGISEGKEIS